MKKYLWSAGCVALLLAACTAKVNVETSDDEVKAPNTAQAVEVPLLNEIRTGHTMLLTKQRWLEMHK